MAIDSRQVSSGDTINADVCIIGAGAAGITLAREFIGQKFTVCVLESGGFQFDSDTQALYGGRIIGRSYYPLESARLRFFGGSTNHWSNISRPLDENDFQKREWMPYSGWPINRKDLDLFYERAQPYCKLGACQYSGDYWSGITGYPQLPLDKSQVETVVFQTSFPPTLFGQQYRDALEKAGNIRIYIYANVTEIVAARQGTAVDHLRVATLSGNKLTVKSTYYILATGGLENPRLMLASRSLQKNGLGNENDLVGRFFMEHPHMNSGEFVPGSERRGAYDLYRHRSAQGTEIFGMLALSGQQADKARIMNAAIELNPIVQPSLGLNSAKKIVVAVKNGELPDDFASHVKNVIGDFDHILDELYKRTFGTKKGLFNNLQPLTHSKLVTRAEQSPNPDSRVKLSTEKDALGVNTIELDWRLSEFDRRSVVKVNEIIAAQFGKHGIGRVKLDLDEHANVWPENLHGGWHHMGTTRMHDDPKRGVVDRNCRVHSLSNLYIAGSSVFTTSGYANPTLTIVALAIRLADHIKANMAKS